MRKMQTRKRGIPQETFKFNKMPGFTNTPCKSTCLYIEPSMHTVELKLDCAGRDALNTSILTALSKAIPQRKHLLDREGAV